MARTVLTTDKSRVILLCSRQAGKSMVSAIALFMWIIQAEQPYPIGFTIRKTVERASDKNKKFL